MYTKSSEEVQKVVAKRLSELRLSEFVVDYVIVKPTAYLVIADGNLIQQMHNITIVFKFPVSYGGFYTHKRDVITSWFNLPKKEMEKECVTTIPLD